MKNNNQNCKVISQEQNAFHFENSEDFMNNFIEEPWELGLDEGSLSVFENFDPYPLSSDNELFENVNSSSPIQNTDSPVNFEYSCLMSGSICNATLNPKKPKNPKIYLRQFKQLEYVRHFDLIFLNNYFLSSDKDFQYGQLNAKVAVLTNLNIKASSITFGEFEICKRNKGFLEYLKALGCIIISGDNYIHLITPKSPISFTIEDYSYFIESQENGIEPTILSLNTKNSNDYTISGNHELDLRNTVIIGDRININASNLIVGNTLFRIKGKVSNLRFNNDSEIFIKVIKSLSKDTYSCYTVYPKNLLNDTLIYIDQVKVKLMKDDENCISFKLQSSPYLCKLDHQCSMVKLFDIKRSENLNKSKKNFLEVIQNETNCKITPRY
ncbi:MAG: hypothetical protein H6586_08880 [Flavobacteriales bacterium]|nr:hypothetical protein [Flavobacteriales bacterium]